MYRTRFRSPQREAGASSRAQSRQSTRRHQRHLLLLSALALAGCSFDVTPPSTEPTVFIRSVTPVLGNGQTGAPGTVLSRALVVEVRATNGILLQGIPVFWDVTSGGGTLDDAVSSTGFDGRAGVQWRLGPTLGTQTATATVEGMQPVVFSATATEGS